MYKISNAITRESEITRIKTIEEAYRQADALNVAYAKQIGTTNSCGVYVVQDSRTRWVDRAGKPI